ncbi:transmembrane protein [Cystoisospora suis]|uniref:Transmembrane protein n=1 Tax=Cystoisospora suis TaxID=483139 RepID=A0A2C6KHZ2_9APIC|nr:transmembrane protein [Cystoisospora suis]
MARCRVVSLLLFLTVLLHVSLTALQDVAGASEDQLGQEIFGGPENENRSSFPSVNSNDEGAPLAVRADAVAAEGDAYQGEHEGADAVKDVDENIDRPAGPPQEGKVATDDDFGGNSSQSSGSEPGERRFSFSPDKADVVGAAEGSGSHQVKKEAEMGLDEGYETFNNSTALNSETEEHATTESSVNKRGTSASRVSSDGNADGSSASATSDEKGEQIFVTSTSDTAPEESSITASASLSDESSTPTASSRESEKSPIITTSDTVASVDAEAVKTLEELSRTQANILENTERLAARFEKDNPENEEIAAALREAATVLHNTIEKLRMCREAYLKDHSRVMEILQRYARARELLDAGIQCDMTDRVDLRNRLTATRDAFKALFLLVSTAERRAESVRALTEALGEAQSSTLAAVLNLAKGSMGENAEMKGGVVSSKTQGNLEEVRRAITNMNDLASAVEHTMRATVDARAKLSEELGLNLIRRFEKLGERRDTASAAEDTEGSTDDFKAPRSHEQVLEDLGKKTGNEPGVKEDIAAAKRAGEALMQELAVDAMKTMQHVAEGTADTLEEAMHTRVLGQAEDKYRASIIVLGVFLCLAIIVLLALIVHALSTLISFHSKFNAARMGEQTGQAHIDDESPPPE